MDKKQVSFYVDGFNLFHGLDRGFPGAMKFLKWLNLPRLFEKEFLNKGCERLKQIFYFSACPDHMRPETQHTHTCYRIALENSGVIYIEGKFKQKSKTCKICHKPFFDHEEKESDVNLALYILKDAYEKASDKIFVITNDSDISPAIRMARIVNPKLSIRVITPPLAIDSATGKQFKPNWELLEACGQMKTNKSGQKFRKSTIICADQCIRNLFPDKIIDSDGKLLTKRPTKYNPPKIP